MSALDCARILVIYSEPMADDASARRRRPRVATDRVYTGKGDAGETRLVGGQRVRKDDVRLCAGGCVDELNACIGVARQSLIEAERDRPDPAVAGLAELLLGVQHQLFDIGCALATLPEDAPAAPSRLDQGLVAALERDMDARTAALPPLRSFVLPGGCRPNAELHLARTVCRRAERACVELAAAGPVDTVVLAYLNRLGDALFVWSRWVSARLGAEEIRWEPRGASDG